MTHILQLLLKCPISSYTTIISTCLSYISLFVLDSLAEILQAHQLTHLLTIFLNNYDCDKQILKGFVMLY